MFRGEKEEMLTLDLVAEPGKADDTTPGIFENAIAATCRHFQRGRPADKWLNDTVRFGWRFRIRSSLAVDLRVRLWQKAEDDGVKVFADNLRDLLLAAPAGTRATMGLDPGFRTGVKVAVVDPTGKVLDTTTIYPHEPQRRWDESIMALAALCGKHKVDLIASAMARPRVRRRNSPGISSRSFPNSRSPRLSSRKLAPPFIRHLPMLRRNCPASMCRCAARSLLRAACRTRSPNS